MFNLFGKILTFIIYTWQLWAKNLSSVENEIVEVLEEADFTEYGREKYNLSVDMLKVIYEIKPSNI